MAIQNKKNENKEIKIALFIENVIVYKENPWVSQTILKRETRSGDQPYQTEDAAVINTAWVCQWDKQKHSGTQQRAQAFSKHGILGDDNCVVTSPFFYRTIIRHESWPNISTL